jgi:hypothetical protein
LILFFLADFKFHRDAFRFISSLPANLHVDCFAIHTRRLFVRTSTDDRAAMLLKTIPIPMRRDGWFERQYIPIRAHPTKAVDDVHPCRSDGGGVDAFMGVAVVIVQVDTRGKMEEIKRFLMPSQFGSEYRMYRGERDDS